MQNRLDGVNRSLSASNRVVMRAKDEQALLDVV
jgi:hypothetical protein